VVYENSGLTASFWIVDGPSTSNLQGLVNVVTDIFVMPTLFFVSEFFPLSSLERKGRGGFSNPNSGD